MAHELSHLKNRDFVIRAFATMARVGLFVHPLSHIIEPAVYRARELLADKSAVELIGDANPLISALSKIRESQNYVPSQSVSIQAACLWGSVGTRRLARLFSKHPTIDTRIKALSGDLQS
jgi:Zn-dependent protease with chaperone function